MAEAGNFVVVENDTKKIGGCRDWRLVKSCRNREFCENLTGGNNIEFIFYDLFEYLFSWIEGNLRIVLKVKVKSSISTDPSKGYASAGENDQNKAIVNRTSLICCRRCYVHI